MQIKYLKLNNIRSYGDKPTIIPFMPGLTLFEGDIGSGKSTILTAIEFSFFGLGDIDAHHLLRHGASKGDVALTFEAGGRDYTIRRSLIKSGRGIKQDTCILEQEEGITEYSPSEIRPKILEILGFNEKPDPKATSRIYRYAVYTPQEAMKEILNMKEDARLDILRRAFGIEQYRWAINNANTILIKSWINPEIRVLDEKSSKASSVVVDFDLHCQKQKDLCNLINDKEREKGNLKEKIEAIDKEKTQLEPQRVELLKLSGEIDPLRNECENIQEQLHQIQESLKELYQEKTYIESRQKEFIDISILYKEYQNKNKQIDKLMPIIKNQEKLDKKKEIFTEKIENVKSSKETRLKELEYQYETKPGIEQNIRKLMHEQESLQRDKQKELELVETLKNINEQVKELEPERDALNSLKGEIPGLKRECKELKIRVLGFVKTADKFKTKLAQITGQEEKLKVLAPQYEEYKSVKEELVALEKTAQHVDILEKEQDRLRIFIENETKNLNRIISQLQDNCEKYPVTLKIIQDLERVQEKLKKTRVTLEKSVEDLYRIKRNITDLDLERNQHETIIHSKDDEIKKLTTEWKKIDSFKIGAKCPRCKQVLTEEHLKTVGIEYTAEIKDIEKTKEKALEEITRISGQLDILNKNLEPLSECEDQNRKTGERLAEIKTELKNELKEQKKLEKLVEEYNKALGIRDKKLVAVEEQKRLKLVDQELISLHPSMKKLSDLKSQLKSLEDAEIPSMYNTISGEISQKAGLLEQTAENQKQIDDARKKISEIDSELTQKQDRFDHGSGIFDNIKRYESQQTNISEELKELQEKLRRLDQIPIELKNFQDKIKNLKDTETEIEDIRNNLQNNQYALKEREVLNSIVVELEKLKPDIDLYNELTKRINELDTENIISKYSEYNTEIRRKPKVIKQIEEEQDKLKKTENLLKDKRTEIRQKKELLDKGKTVIEHLKNLEERWKSEQSALSECRESIAAFRSDLKGLEVVIKKIDDDLKEFQKIAKLTCILETTKRWLADDFIPVINNIEKQVLANINEQFNTIFQRSFNMLIENEDISVSVDESFTPILEQEGYEMDVTSLSGGEKTSIALAYRLALNTMVKQQIPSLKSSLLILDEPTDGFSSSQLYKLRDILRDTHCEQIIMVSHENELEGFVDSIYRVTKENGVSRVRA
jgi:exonuclease SbcC